MEREVGGGIGMGNTCKPMAGSFQCMTKFTTKKKKKSVTMGNPDGEGAVLPFSSHLKNMIELPVWWLLTSD